MAKLIGLIGDAGVGKTTIAQGLERRGWRRASFGTGIKNMTRAFLSDAGFTPGGIERYTVSMKDTNLPGFDMTSRQLQIAIGQGLRAHDPDVWVKITSGVIIRYMEAGWDVVVDDIRQQNEADTIHALGGSVVRIHVAAGRELIKPDDLPGMDRIQEDYSWQPPNTNSKPMLGYRAEEVIHARSKQHGK